MVIMSMVGLFKPFIITPTWRFESLGWRSHTKRLSLRGWMGRRFASVLLGWRDGQRDRPTTGSPSVQWLWGQRLHDSDETLKAFLSRKLADVLPSKQRNWVTFRRAQLLGLDRMPTYFFWRLVCLVCVTAKGLSAVVWVRVSFTTFLLVTVWLTVVIFYTGSVLECSVPRSTAVSVENENAAIMWRKEKNKKQNKHGHNVHYKSLFTVRMLLDSFWIKHNCLQILSYLKKTEKQNQTTFRRQN